VLEEKRSWVLLYVAAFLLLGLSLAFLFEFVDVLLQRGVLRRHHALYLREAPGLFLLAHGAGSKSLNQSCVLQKSNEEKVCFSTRQSVPAKLTQFLLDLV